MRKFLVEMEYVVTLEDMRDEWNMWARDGESFAQYLENCMARNNGALTEILTADTPDGELSGAVTLCRVQYSEDENDYCEEWLTGKEICEKWRDGCGIKYVS